MVVIRKWGTVAQKSTNFPASICDGAREPQQIPSGTVVQVAGPVSKTLEASQAFRVSGNLKRQHKKPSWIWWGGVSSARARSRNSTRRLSIMLACVRWVTVRLKGPFQPRADLVRRCRGPGRNSSSSLPRTILYLPIPVLKSLSETNSHSFDRRHLFEGSRGRSEKERNDLWGLKSSGLPMGSALAPILFHSSPS